MNRIILILIISLIQINCFSQQFVVIFNSNGDYISDASLIFEYKNGGKEIINLKSNSFHKYDLDNSDKGPLAFLEFTNQIDTTVLIVEDFLYFTGIIKTSKFDGILKDTLSIFIDRYPFEKDKSTSSAKQLGVYGTPVFNHMEFVIIEDSPIISFFNNQFSIENLSTYFANDISNDVCDCMKDKELNKDNFSKIFTSCLENQHENVTSKLDQFITMFYQDQDEILEIINQIFYKVNMYVIENCIDENFR